MIDRRLLAAGIATAGLALTAPLAQAAPRAVTVTPTTKATWAGTPGSGLNVSWFTDSLRPSGQCGADPQTYCDDTLVHFTSDKELSDSALTFRMDGFQQTSDFDLRVYLSDETGEPIEYLGSPTGDAGAASPLGTSDPRNTSAGDFETKVVETAQPGDYYLVRVVYFAVANDSYKGTVTWAGTPAASSTSAKAKQRRLAARKAAKRRAARR